jgi:CHAT domain-containing protein/tetratricopeptide (TPR) repeat protein
MDSALLYQSISRGESAYVRGAFDSARGVWLTALNRSGPDRNPILDARLRTWIGLAAYRTGDYANARRYGEDALALKIRHDLRSELFKSYNALGLLAWNQGRLRDAVLLYSKATDAAREVRDEGSIAKAANNLGLVYAELGEFDKARAGYDEARRFGNKTSDPMMEARALTNGAALEIELGDPVSAIAKLEVARALYKIAGDRTGEQNAMGQLGWAFHMMGDPGRALIKLDSALALSRAQGLRQEEASNIELIAAVHRKAGRLRSALTLYRKASLIDKELDLLVERGNNLRQTAEIHSQLHQLDLARTGALQALALHRSNSARIEEIHDLLMLADLERSRPGARDSIGRIVAAARKIAIALKSRPARLEVALAEASLNVDLGNSRDAINVIRSAEQDIARGSYSDQFAAAAITARAYATLSILDSAAREGFRATSAIERVRDRFDSPVFRASFVADQLSVYSELVGVLLRMNRIEDAFDVSDAAHSRSLITNISLAGGQSGRAGETAGMLIGSERLLKRIDALVSRLDAVDEQTAGSADLSANLRDDGLTAELMKLRTQYEDVLSRIVASRSPEAMIAGSPALSGAAVKSSLQPDEALVEFLLADDRLFTFVVTSRGISSLTQPLQRADLERRIRLTRETIDRAQSEGTVNDVLLVSLRKIVIGPIEERGLLNGVRRLILVPHGSLSYLPFAALKRSPNGRYLIEDYSIAYVPSAATLAALRSTRTMKPPQLSLNGTVFIPFDAELPGSVVESRSIREGMKTWTELRGASATERALRTAMSGTAAIHLATHGSMNSINPMFSRIDLAAGKGGSTDDGRIEVYELLSTPVKSGLVFLSGCETGLGAAGANQFGAGDDYATLAQAFLFAGAGSVAATIWRISDDGAAAFAKRFYSSLEKAGPVEGLALAQRQMLRDARYRRPYYWAGYQVSPWIN